MNEVDFIDAHLRIHNEDAIEWECKYCGDKDLSKSVSDHIVPRARGGSEDRKNRQRICWRCNAAKGDSTEEEFEKWLEDTTAFRLKGRNK